MPGGIKGVQGRKPKPTALRLLAGNPGKRAINKDEPRVRPSIPACPRELSLRVKREWRKLAVQLYDAGVLTEIDRIALAGLVVSYVRWIEAQEGLIKTGLLVKGPNGIPRQNPLIRIGVEAQSEYVRLLGEFGMSPSSRSRLHVDKPVVVDEFEREFGG